MVCVWARPEVLFECFEGTNDIMLLVFVLFMYDTLDFLFVTFFCFVFSLFVVFWANLVLVFVRFWCCVVSPFASAILLI